MNLWLFDIDGTLVNINHVHLASYKEDYKRILKRDVPDALILSTFGMSERESHETVLKELGINSVQLIEQIIREHPHTFERMLQSTEITPLPGVIPFLTKLKKSNEVLGVVTGNLEGIAKTILKKSKLLHFFNIVSCDNGKSTRGQIVQRAIDHAREKASFSHVIVVGDTTYDIKAGKAVGATTIAVATGSDSFETLKAEKPDMVIRSLKDHQIITDKLK